MKKLSLLCIVLLLSSITAFAQYFQWAKKQENSFLPQVPNFYNPPTTGGNLLPTGGNYLAAANSIVVQTGLFSGSITFNNQTLTASNSLNAYLAVHDQLGNLLWVKQLAGGTRLQPSLVVDKQDNIIITGYFIDSLAIGSSKLKTSTPGNSGIYIVKFDPAGSLLWARSSDLTTGNFSPNALDFGISTDSAGNIFASGSFGGSLTFHGTTLVSGHQSNTFLVKYSANGIFQWAVTPPILGYNLSFKVSVAGFVYLLKTTYNNATSITTHSILKLSPAGSVLWNKSIVNNTNSGTGASGIGLTLDDIGNAYLCGTSNVTNIVIDTTILSPINGSCFLAKLDNVGNWKWAKIIANGVISGSGVTLPNNKPHLIYTSNNRLAIAGLFLGTAQFTGFPTTISPNDNGTFVTLLDTAGTVNWVTTILKNATPQSKVFPNGLAAGENGNIYLYGELVGNIDFGPITLNSPNTEVSYLTKINVTNALAVKENRTLLKSFKLYPNPAKNYVMIAAAFKKNTSATVSLVNLLGQTLSKVNLPANNQIHYQMPLNELPKGVYLIRLETETGMQTQRLVIQ